MEVLRAQIRGHVWRVPPSSQSSRDVVPKPITPNSGAVGPIIGSFET